MKSLMLLNARKRRKARRSRRSRRNPVGSTSAYRANFPKSMGKKTTRRRRSLRVKRFRTYKGQQTVAVRARKIYVSRPSRKKAIISAINPRRRRRRSRSRIFRMNPLGGNVLSQVKSVFSRENLTIAGGGVAATLLTNFLLKQTKKDGTSLLPMGTGDSQKAFRLAYAVGVPVLGAMLTRRFNPSLAKGMLLGGLINGIIEGTKSYAPDLAKQVGLGEYLEYTPMSAVGATPGYSAINQFSAVRPMNSAFSNSSAFPADAWGR